MTDVAVGLAISGLALLVAILYSRMQNEKDRAVVAEEAARRLAKLSELRRKQLEGAYEKVIHNIDNDKLADELNRKLRTPNGKL